jgi:hypothetical protein
MHGSVWTFRGDPEQLLRAYDGMVAEIQPGVALHVCLRTPDGIVFVDTCPDRDSFTRFATSEDFQALRERHGLPEPDHVDDYPVHAAIVDGVRVAAA